MTNNNDPYQAQDFIDEFQAKQTKSQPYVRRNSKGQYTSSEGYKIRKLLREEYISLLLGMAFMLFIFILGFYLGITL